MLEEELKCIDTLNTENVKNMAHLENILEFHKIHMSKDDEKYILDEYSACDKHSKNWHKAQKILHVPWTGRLNPWI